jgi:hypothetical protein
VITNDESAHCPVSIPIRNYPPKTAPVVQAGFEPARDGEPERKGLLLPGLEPGDLALAMPKLAFVRADELLGGLDRGGIVGAIQVRGLNLAVFSDDMNPVIRHGTSRLNQRMIVHD